MHNSLPDKAVRSDLDALASLGYITRLPGDRYALTAKGREALKASEQ